VLGDRDERLLEPTLIYVRAVRELLESDVEVRGLAHITGEGFLNLLRLEAAVGYRIDRPLPVPAIFTEIAERGSIEPAEMHEVFNMGCGFCCVVPAEQADAAIAVLVARHPGAALIGRTTTAAGVVELPGVGLRGTREGF
jgi:phosphoribosylformylglycinamidine cyclo-ligase